MNEWLPSKYIILVIMGLYVFGGAAVYSRYDKSF